MHNRGGFTVVETLIVLAITGMMFFIGVTAISGRQGRTEFSQGMREIDSMLKDVLNDVSNGFYPSVSNLSCQATNNNLAPTLSYDNANSDTTGLNGTCVFAGKVIQIGTDTDDQQVYVYSLAGRRQYLNSSAQVVDVQSFQYLKPVAITPSRAGNDSRIDATESKKLPNNISIIKNDKSAGGWAFGILFRNFLGSTAGSGTTNVGIVPVSRGATNLAQMSVTNVLANIDSLQDSAFLNPTDTITLCFKSGTSNQNAVIQVSGVNGGMTTTLSFDVTLASYPC